MDGSRETAPAVTRVFLPDPSNGDTYELGEVIEVSIFFDRPIDSTGQATLALTVGSTTRQATQSSPRFSSLTFGYVVQSSDRDADGISIGANALTLNGGTIRIRGGSTDASLNLGSHAISNSANHKVDGSVETAPAVTWWFLWSAPASGDTYEFGEVIWGTVRFSRAVEVSGEPLLALTIGSATRQASYFVSVGATKLFASFQYIVQAADADADGISVGASALTLNGGTIRTKGGTANAALSLGSYAIARRQP